MGNVIQTLPDTCRKGTRNMGRIATAAFSVFLLSVLLLPTSVLRAESRAGRNPIAAIEADYQAGQMSIDQKALLQVTAQSSR